MSASVLSSSFRSAGYSSPAGGAAAPAFHTASATPPPDPSISALPPLTVRLHPTVNHSRAWRSALSVQLRRTPSGTHPTSDHRHASASGATCSPVPQQLHTERPGTWPAVGHPLRTDRPAPRVQQIDGRATPGVEMPRNICRYRFRRGFWIRCPWSNRSRQTPALRPLRWRGCSGEGEG